MSIAMSNRAVELLVEEHGRPSKFILVLRKTGQVHEEKHIEASCVHRNCI